MCFHKLKGTLLRAVVTRPHKKCNGEISAKIISDYLPFMEYELHRQLLGKLKLKGMNMLYGLRVQISIGENLLTGIAEATACKGMSLKYVKYGPTFSKLSLGPNLDQPNLFIKIFNLFQSSFS